VRSDNRVYMPAVDHLRVAAAVFVVLFHGMSILRDDGSPEPGMQPGWVYSLNPLETFIAEGHTGVALFMVLSGFILTTGSLGRDINYRSFMRNRLLRVGPLFLVLLLIAMVVARHDFSLIGAQQTSLGFARFNGGFYSGPFAQVLWTIGVELQFYLVFPFFLRLLTTRGPRPIVLFILFMVVVRILAALTAPAGLDYNQMTYFSIVGRIDQFLIGMLAAYFFLDLKKYLGRAWVTGVAMGVVVGALWVFNQMHGYAEPGLFRTVWVDVEGLIWAAVLVSYVGTERFGRGRLSTALAWAGERSYGIYLLHMPLIYLVLYRDWRFELTGRSVVDATITTLVLVVPAVMLLASLSYAAVEQPFLSLRRKYVAVQPEPPKILPPVTQRVSRHPAVDVHPRAAEQRVRV
jgi:peptidoglycan/LPS O-acetylase OafA/YrhL